MKRSRIDVNIMKVETGTTFSWIFYNDQSFLHFILKNDYRGFKYYTRETIKERSSTALVIQLHTYISFIIHHISDFVSICLLHVLNSDFLRVLYYSPLEIYILYDTR